MNKSKSVSAKAPKKTARVNIEILEIPSTVGDSTAISMCKEKINELVRAFNGKK